jgi:hypothetical protein
VLACSRRRRKLKMAIRAPGARELIYQGRLPRMASLDTWDGLANAELCSVCGQVIDLDDVEYEVGYHRTAGGSSLSLSLLVRTPPGNLNAPAKSIQARERSPGLNTAAESASCPSVRSMLKLAGTGAIVMTEESRG